MGDFMRSTKQILVLLASIILLFSCGKDNKTNSSSTPVPIVGTGSLNPSNILAPFDPSFETVQDNVNSRRLPEINARFFRVKSRRSARADRRTRSQSQIVNGISFSGDKALQLFNAQNQVLSFPLDTERKGRPLNLIPGARYRFSAKVRLPRGNQFGQFSAQFTTLLFSEDRRISNDTSEASYPWPQDGSWIEITQEFETPSLTQKGSFNLSFSGSSDVIVDDLVLIRIR
jgi:hypothetical protein